MENIVLQDERKEQIKIVDFGLSNIYVSDDPLRTHCGSPEYAAPELFVVGKRYGPEVDLWSLGVVLYGMIIGRLPFLCPRDEWTSSEDRRRRLMIQINKGLTSIQEKAMYRTSNNCRNLINRLLAPSARERITIREILDHPWILASSKNNLHLCSEDDSDISNHLMIVNEIATAMRTTVAAVEAEIIRRKYGEIGGMYNIKLHKLHQTSVPAAAYQLAPQFLQNSTRRTKNISSSATIRSAKDNLRNRTSTNSDNHDHVIIMRRGEMQDRSIKNSSPLHSRTWNWQGRSKYGNYCSEQKSAGIYDTLIMNNARQQHYASQVTKNQDDNKISAWRLGRDKTHQTRNSTSYINSKRMEKSRDFSENYVGNCEITPSFSILRTYSRVSSESVPASRVKESFHKKILIPWRYRVGSARTRRDT